MSRLRVERLEDRCLLSGNYVHGMGWHISGEEEAVFIAPTEEEWLANESLANISAFNTITLNEAEKAGGGPPIVEFTSPSELCWMETDGANYCEAVGNTGQGEPPWPILPTNASVDYAVGRVHVTVVAFESDGTIDPNQEDWTASEISTIRSETLEGLRWWEDTFNNYHGASEYDLSFSINMMHLDNPVFTPYEPINRNTADQGLWISSFLDLAYPSYTNYFSGVSAWNATQRDLYNADWAYTMFVVDDTVDPNNMFPNNQRFAYAYIGGPFTVLTIGNDGWGINKFGQVLAHETGHIFRALDEYPGGSSYYSTSGYYSQQNTNAADNRPAEAGSQQASIMAQASLQGSSWNNNIIPESTRGEVGWRDSDSDGTIDIFDQFTSVVAEGGATGDTIDPNTSMAVDAGDLYRIQGTAAPGVYAYPGGTQDSTLSRAKVLQFRIDAGYIDVLPNDIFGAGMTGYKLADNKGGWFTLETRQNEDAWSFDHTLNISSISTVQQKVLPLMMMEILRTGPPVEGDLVNPQDMTPYDPLGYDPNVVWDAYQNGTLDQLGLVAQDNSALYPPGEDGGELINITNMDGTAGMNFVVPDFAAVGTYNHRIELRVVDNTNRESGSYVIGWWNDETTLKRFSTSKNSLTTSENGITDSFDVWLDFVPDSSVTIDFIFDDTEGSLDQTQLVFDDTNWWIPQTVVVTGVADNLIDGDVTYNIGGTIMSGDAEYTSTSLPSLSVTNTDIDMPQVKFNGTEDFIWFDLIEGDPPQTFDVTLSHATSQDVFVTFDDPSGAMFLEGGTASQITLTFTSFDWDQSQTVSVVKLEDEVFDPILYTQLNISVISSDPLWDGIWVNPVYLYPFDNDGPRLVMTPSNNQGNPLVVHEDGTVNAQFTVELSEQPIGSVEIYFWVADSNDESQFDPTELMLDFNAQVFDEFNWNSPAIITVQGLDDGIEDGNQLQFIKPYVNYANDPIWYQAWSEETYVTVIDNYVPPAPESEPRAIVTVEEKLVVNENGSTAQFVVALNTQPAQDVIVRLSSTDIGEGVLDKTELIFTSDNWNVPQLVTVTGVQDFVKDGNQQFAIQFDGLADDLLFINKDKKPLNKDIVDMAMFDMDWFDNWFDDNWLWGNDDKHEKRLRRKIKAAA